MIAHENPIRAYECIHPLALKMLLFIYQHEANQSPREQNIFVIYQNLLFSLSLKIIIQRF